MVHVGAQTQRQQGQCTRPTHLVTFATQHENGDNGEDKGSVLVAPLLSEVVAQRCPTTNVLIPAIADFHRGCQDKEEKTANYVSSKQSGSFNKDVGAESGKPQEREMNLLLFPATVITPENPKSFRLEKTSVTIRSGMLEAGVDRIISQVVDPKLNHIFRPQIERAIHEFLAAQKKEESVPAPPPEPENKDPPAPSQDAS
ncbi:hypothetical protein BTVI_41345 [Pitangus sulphuratus]|nr:hypothetical protein BTVI_41345 [Pitangus sulphuratus]